MSLSDLASLGSFASGVAVLVSLIFLYFQLRQLGQQVRQAEKNQQSAVRQGRTAAIVEVALAWAEPDAARAVIAAAAGDGLTDVQLSQFISLTRAVFITASDAFYQHREGLLDDVAFESSKRTAATGLRSASRRVAWQRLRGSFGADFEAFIDELITRTPVGTPQSSGAVVDRWQADLAAERAKAI